jgi:serine/alanine adding enzyme
MIHLVKNWNSYLNSFPDNLYDAYFEEEYVKLYETKKEEAVCFIYEQNHKLFLFPFLRRSFDFSGQIYYDFETPYGYGGPITNVYDEAFLYNALKSLNDFCTNNNYIAGFIRFHPLFNNYKSFNSIGTTIFDRHTIAIDLTLNENEIWMNEIHTKNRNVIKKGFKSGLEFIVDKEFEHLNEFKKIYESTMNKVNADSYFFFQNNYYSKFKQGIKNSFLGLVSFEGKIIAGALFFFSKDYGHYHLAGSDSNYLKENPNNFMLYNAALTMKTLGIKKFHLGGGYNSQVENTLYQFKNKFSKSIYDFYIGKIIFNQSIYNQLCAEWIFDNPLKKELYKFHLLKYKY